MAIIRTDRTYRDVSNINLGSTSRLNAYNVLNITETNQYFLNIFKYFEIPNDVKNNNNFYITYVCIDTDWWDNISYVHYDTSYYWYLLCMFNDVVNPYESLYEGKQIKIVKSSYFYYIFRDYKYIRDL